MSDYQDYMEAQWREYSETVVDEHDKEIKVGTRVKLEYDLTQDGKAKHYRFVGTVTEISEMDGDVDDYGRPVAYYPKITVKFDNPDWEGEPTDDFDTIPLTNTYEPEMRFQTGDLEVIEDEDEPPLFDPIHGEV